MKYELINNKVKEYETQKINKSFNSQHEKQKIILEYEDKIKIMVDKMNTDQ